jgi:osmoprotectant transport system ATP-binding protein
MLSVLPSKIAFSSIKEPKEEISKAVSAPEAEFVMSTSPASSLEARRQAFTLLNRSQIRRPVSTRYPLTPNSGMLAPVRIDSTIPAIEFRNVSYQVAGTTVLQDFNLEVQSGEILVLLGRSGSGKTTTLKLINRLLTPSAGQIRVKGVSNSDIDLINLRRSMGYVIQEVGLFPHFNVTRNIGLVPRIEGWPENRIRARVHELLQLTGLPPETAARHPHQLSGGQRQRVGVARALAADPEILLMDEPFGALDPLTRDELQREFLALQKRLGKTVLFVTHDLHEAMRLGSKIGLMEAGKLVTLLTPQQFLRSDDPLASAYVRAFGDRVDSTSTEGNS